MGKKQPFTVPGRYDRIKELCAFVVAGAQEVGFDDDELFRIELACDEACTNIIQHAYGGEETGDIEATWQFIQGKFVITLHDNGMPFDVDEVPMPNLPADKDDINNLQIGGLGIHFMKKLMDEVRFSIDNNHGNTLIMIKYLKGKEPT